LLGESALYRQFRLNEPWDSPHNRKLLKKMPKVYAAPGVKTRVPYSTFYQVFVGPGAAFESGRYASFPASFTDGTSNTLLVVEAGQAVPWTKPEDIPFDPARPLPRLGGLFPGVFNAAFADGSVHALRTGADPIQLRRLITCADGYPVEMERVKAPTSARQALLMEQNQRLKQELQRQRQRVAALAEEKELLRDVVEDPETKRLRKENARLEKQLREVREQADRLNREIQRLKRAEKRRGAEEE
jgi:prepilin-type processing-associated H-X9-DG protein